MKKLTTSIFFSILALAGFTTQTNAQEGSTIGVNLRAGVPVGDFAEYAGFGLGGGINYQYLLTENFSIGIEAGYMSFLENQASQDPSIEINTSSVVVPIIANARYHFGDSDVRPFVGLGLGYSIVEQTATVSVPNFDPVEFDGTYSGFTIAPHVGATFSLSDATSIYLAADYSYVLNSADLQLVDDSGDPVTGGPSAIVIDPYSYIGINLGIQFALGQ